MKAGGAGRGGERSRVRRQHGRSGGGGNAISRGGSMGRRRQRRAGRAKSARARRNRAIRGRVVSHMHAIPSSDASECASPDSAGMRGPRPLSAWHTVQQTSLIRISRTAPKSRRRNRPAAARACILMYRTCAMYCEVSVRARVCAHFTFDIRETHVNSMFISLPIISLVFSTCLVLHIFDVPRALREWECGLAE